MPQRLFRILAFSGRPQRTILASASSCAPQRSLRALAFLARPDSVWHMVPSARPNTRPFAVSQPRFALSQFRLPRASFLSRSFGSLAPVFSARPSIYPGPVFRARSLGASCMPPVASATQSPHSLLFPAYFLHVIHCFLAIIWQILEGNSAGIAIFLTEI